MFLDNDIVLEQGDYRVKVMGDYDPILPDGDAYAPQFMVPTANNQRDDLLVNISPGTAAYLTNALNIFEYNVDTFKRWSRIFHGVNADIISTTGYSQGELAFIIMWPDEQWLETVGLDSSYVPTTEDTSDLASYIWGDVIALELQVLTEWTSSRGDTMETYDDIDLLGGLYVNQGQGDDYIKEIAQELLESNITQHSCHCGYIHV